MQPRTSICFTLSPHVWLPPSIIFSWVGQLRQQLNQVMKAHPLSNQRLRHILSNGPHKRLYEGSTEHQRLTRQQRLQAKSVILVGFARGLLREFEASKNSTSTVGKKLVRVRLRPRPNLAKISQQKSTLIQGLSLRKSSLIVITRWWTQLR